MTASIRPASISRSSIAVISARTRPLRPFGAKGFDSVCGAVLPGYM